MNKQKQIYIGTSINYNVLFEIVQCSLTLLFIRTYIGHISHTEM